MLNNETGSGLLVRCEKLEHENKVLKKALEIARDCVCQNCHLIYDEKNTKFCANECNARNTKFFIEEANIELGFKQAEKEVEDEN